MTKRIQTYILVENNDAGIFNQVPECPCDTKKEVIVSWARDHASELIRDFGSDGTVTFSIIKTAGHLILGEKKKVTVKVTL